MRAGDALTGRSVQDGQRHLRLECHTVLLVYDDFCRRSCHIESRHPRTRSVVLAGRRRRDYITVEEELWT